MRTQVSRQPIAVFDSGIGGLSVLRALRTELPEEDFIYYADSAYAPYGEQDDAYVRDRSFAVAHQLLVERGAKALVVACNTATAAAIEALRQQYPQTPIVGIEPALKPAVALTRTGVVGVMATRSTLASARFHSLLGSVQDTAPGVRFVCQPCDGLAEAIETLIPIDPGQASDAINLIAMIAQYTLAMGSFGLKTGEIDTLVLGCTHYPLAQAQVRSVAGNAVRLLEPGGPVAKRTRQLLQDRGLLTAQTLSGSLTLLSSGSQAALQEAATRWLGT